MADITSRATVDLNINGRNARKEMDDLRKSAAEARKEMDRLAEAGDKKGAQKKQKEFQAMERQMRRLQSSAEYFGQTLQMLDKASLKDLRGALRYLNKELETMERGSEAWNRQAEKIRRVRAQIDSVNSALRTQQSETSGAIGFFQKWQTALVAGYAMIVGWLNRVVGLSRQAVEAYASMEQEMANVRKYTGMESEDVEALNAEFRKIDTRTSREELNRLAQEAGRLGKTSAEDVLGFVRAADKINVALDDLGEGATLTLSKLTGIFGDEKRLGTEKALLSVGSVINELSQNCAASAPYLAEFASRMGGVGAQAGMTVQQIMAFGAVLDSSNQNVEASSTALQQVIVRLLQDPAKYARVAGLDVKRFSELVRTDMNAAVIELLETLQKAGGMDVLSPMFKDMGENGSRTISTLAALAGHIDEVKAQQLEANKAFAEATSIDKEFDVQNNTVQASLDKQRKRVADLRVELGERLLPVVRLANSSAELSLKVLNATIGFIIKYKTELTIAAAAVMFYATAVNFAAIKLAVWNAWTKSTIVLHKALTPLFSVIRLGVIGLYNSYEYLTKGLQVNYAMQQRWRDAWSRMNLKSWIGLIAAVTIAVYSLAKSWRKSAEEQKVWRQSLAEAERQAREEVAKDIELLDQLYKKSQDHKISIEERTKAIEILRSKYPDYFKDISNEAFLAGKAADEYARLKKEILNAARARGMEAQIEDLEKKKQDIQTEYDDKRRYWAELSLERRSYVTDPSKLKNDPDYKLAQWNLKALEKKYQPQIDKIESTQESLADQVSDYKIKNAPQTDNDPDPDVSDRGGGYTSTVLAEKERKKREAEARRAAIKARKEFKAELDGAKGDWEAGDSRNIAEYTQGLKSWTEFLTEKHRLQEKFYDDQLAIFERNNLQEDEDYKELLKKKEQLEADWLKRKAAMAVDDAKLAQKAEEVQAQIDYSTPGNALFRNEEVLQARLFDIRIKYLGKMREAYNSDSREYHDYTVQITQAEEEEKLRIRKRFAELYAKYSTEYLNKTAKEQLDYQISLLTALQQAGQLSMEEFMKAVAKLRQETVIDSLPESARKQESPEESDQKAMQKDLAALKAKYDAQLMTEEEYLKAKERIEAYYQKKAVDRARQSGNEFSTMVIDLYEAFKAFGEDGDDNLWGKIGAAAQASFALMNAAMSAYTEFSKAQLDLQVARIEKRYEREAALAEGNVYKEKQAERKKQKEIAKAKNEANRKQFAMSVISAVAQTAVNAINAYGAGLQVGGPAGLVLAPIAAAMAIAAGMIQIATLRKQQQASEAQGYAEGGFTPKGRKNDPVGVVHAGEWVAPQEMVNSPATRPIINMLENARRNNRIGSIRYSDVSAASAPALAVRGQERKIVVETPPQQPAADPELTSAISRLNSRLNEPFVTVNTVTGDHGIRRAQDEYDRLMRNKSRR